MTKTTSMIKTAKNSNEYKRILKEEDDADINISVPNMIWANQHIKIIDP